MSLLFSDAYGDEILAAYFGGGTWTVPTNWHATLWTGNPFVSGSAELSMAGGYGFITVPNNGLTFAEAVASGSGYAVANEIEINFPDVGTASADWETARYMAFSRVSGDPPEVALKLPEPVTCLSGNRITFPIGSLRLEFSSEEAPALVLEAWALAHLKRIFGGSTAGGPATWYLGLYTGNPYLGGSEVSATGTGYARVVVTNDASNFDPVTVEGKRAVKLNGAVRWPAIGTATAAFGQVLYVGFSEGLTAAPKFVRPLPGSGRYVGVGGFLGIPADGLIISLTSAET